MTRQCFRQICSAFMNSENCCGVEEEAEIVNATMEESETPGKPIPIGFQNSYAIVSCVSLEAGTHRWYLCYHQVINWRFVCRVATIPDKSICAKNHATGLCMCVRRYTQRDICSEILQMQNICLISPFLFR